MTRYDEVPYACQPIPCTAPEQLALASLLHGGPCPRVEGARVLEIGCGDGANLLPLAFFRPDCEFVGVDDSRVQIADARRSAERLTLGNVTLHEADICDVGPSLGEFDYVVAHGVMSWVSDHVRDAIFAVCRDHLARDGLAYLSFNTNPGWLIRGLVRSSTLRPGAIDQALQQLADDARERARTLRVAIESAEHPYAELLSRELGRLEVTGESALLHDYLAQHNRAYWFREFASLAAGFGLRYLVEAGFTTPDYRVPPTLREAARALESDPIGVEELIDVLWYRQHRASLFCREGAIGATPSSEALFERVTLAAGCRPRSEQVRLEAGIEESFVGLLETEVSTTSSDPLEKAALSILASAWPLGLGWRELVAKSRQLLRERGVGDPSASAEVQLRAVLLELHGLGQCELRLRAMQVPKLAMERPALLPLTRWEAERRTLITTPTHQRISLTVADRLILERLTGEQTPDEIARGVVDALRASGAASDVPESMSLEEWVQARLAQDVTLLAAWGLLL